MIKDKHLISNVRTSTSLPLFDMLTGNVSMVAALSAQVSE